MKTLTIALAAGALLAGLAAPVWADKAAVKIKDGPQRDLVASNCTPCHSLDYIGMNSPFLDRKGWDGTVAKMIKVMGAKISQDDVTKIVDYLTQNYGKS